MQGSTSLLTTLLLMCMPPLFAPPQRMAEPTPFILDSSLLQKPLHSGDFNCHYSPWDSKGTSDHRREEVLDWVISSDLLPPNEPDTATLLHRSSPEISFAPSSLAFSCSWEGLQDLGTDQPTNSSIRPSLSGLSPQPASPFLQFSESLLG